MYFCPLTAVRRFEHHSSNPQNQNTSQSVGTQDGIRDDVAVKSDNIDINIPTDIPMEGVVYKRKRERILHNFESKKLVLDTITVINDHNRLNK